MTDSICCSVDSPTVNCASSGANDYIEIEGAREPPIQGFGVDRVGDGNRWGRVKSDVMFNVLKWIFLL